MPRHADDEEVMVNYFSNRNISFHSGSEAGEELGITWGEWRNISQHGRDEIIQEFMNELVEVCIVDDED